MTVSLYRAFRPTTFCEVVGQDHIVKILTNQIKTASVGHAYLFTGARGTGKTSTAKIFARAVSCIDNVNGSPCGACKVCLMNTSAENVDIFEMDGASNNSVDDIRLLRDNCNFPPVGSKYKVYIIDEVHMLSQGAFNALLKTLEEPPAHMIFILATTEVHKVPDTVLSRCMRLDFRLIPTDIIAGRLEDIFKASKISYESQAIYAIAKLGEGCMRDALSYADIALAYAGGEKVTHQGTLKSLMINAPEDNAPLAEAILKGDVKQALHHADILLKNNSGANVLRREISELFKNLIFLRSNDDYKSLNLTKDLYEVLKPLAVNYEAGIIYRALEIFAGLENQLRYSSNPRILLEAAVVKAADFAAEYDEGGLVLRIKKLEERLTSGGETVLLEKKADDAVAEQKKNDINLESRASGVNAEKNTDSQSIEREATILNVHDARQILAKVIAEFRKKGLFQLYASMENVTDTEIVGCELIIYFPDEADYNAFVLPSNMAAAQDILSKLSSSYKIKAVYKRQEIKNVKAEVDRIRGLLGEVDVKVK